MARTFDARADPVDTAAMSRYLVAIALAVVGCTTPDHRQLAEATAFDLARTHGRYVVVNGVDTFAIVMGQGSDIVLLHGNPSSTYSWRHVIEPLARSHRVHAIDLPGYGMSEKPPDAPYHATWFAGHVAAYMEVAGIDRAVVVGNSMGGEVASEVAALYPRRVAGLVLIAASGLPADQPAEMPFALRAARWPGAGTLLSWLPLRPILAATLRDAYYDPALLTDGDIDAYVAPLRSRNGTVAFLTRMRAGDTLDRSRVVATITAPTLVIVGETDRLVPPKVGKRYHELIAASRHVMVAKSGHLPQEETPQALLVLLEDWLAGLSGSAAAATAAPARP